MPVRGGRHEQGLTKARGKSVKLTPAFRKAAKQIKLLALDVDGVLTDGSIVLDNHGVEYKAFNVRDGHGIKMAQRVGIRIALITGRTSEVVTLRARELGIVDVYQGSKDKRVDYVKLKEAHGLKDEEVAFVGDDIVDLPVMLQVGLPIAVADAEEYVKERALYVASRQGGRGAVREVIDMILRARGEWDGILEKYTKA